MQIHTTQNLSSLAQQQTNCVSLSDLRFTHGSVYSSLGTPQDSYNSSIAFGKKKPNPKNARNIIKKLKEKVTVGDIQEKAGGIKKKRFMDSNAFETMLKLAENEPVIQATMAALICIGLRPMTIMALPNKHGADGKQNNMYAASHAISSGIIGLGSTLIIAQPFKSGSKYVMDYMYKDLKLEALERLHPHLDLNSITNADGTRKPIAEWLDKAGNKFMKDCKDVEKIPILKAFNDISAESFAKFGADVDWAKYKGKSFNEVFTRDGKSLYDALDWNRIGIIVEKDGMNDARVLIRDMDRDFFKQVVEDADSSSYWKKLNLESVFDKNGKVKDYRTWKDLDGNQWKLDFDEAYISSEYDTAKYMPRISGKINGDKYACYDKNGKNGELGSEITKERLEIAKRNEIHEKIITWLPDLISRPLVATATIALIPVALSKVFHVQKAKPKVEEVDTENKLQDAPKEDNNVVEDKKSTVAFKGKENEPDSNISFKGNSSAPPKKPSLWERLIAKPLANIYAKPLYESKRVSDFSAFLTKLPGKMTTHMSTLGALITSAFYVIRTLKNKDLDPEKRRTLAVNQTLCFFVPTIGAYAVDSAISDWVKKVEYEYAGRQERKIRQAELEGKSAEYINSIKEGLGKRLNGVRILAGLATFTLIYRYVAPVLITPAANWIGDRINAKRKAKAAEASEAKTVVMTPSDNNSKSDLKTEAKTIVMDNSDDATKENKFHSAA